MRVAYDTVDHFEGWRGARGALEGMLERFGARDVLEIGAGANPTLPVDVVRTRGLRYTSNDVSQDELDKADETYDRVCLDFSECEPPAALHGKFDLVFSRMVNEHVRDGERYYRNIARVLKPGGITLHWFSTLYALPFLSNRLLPDVVSRRLLSTFAPRNEFQHGKFQAYYSWGRGPTKSMLSKLQSLNYEVLEYTGYFGHTYYSRRLPLLHRLEQKKAIWLAAHPLPLLTSYARVLLRKTT